MSSDPVSNDCLNRARHNDVEAFGDLMERHVGWIRAMLRSRMRDWAAADDLAQEAFVTAFRKIRDFRPGTSFEAWIKSIAINHLRNYQRKHREEYIGGSLELDILMSRQPPAIDACGGAMDALHHCLDEIGRDARALLEKRYLKGLSVRELSEETGRGYSALTMQFHRLREILAACIEKTIAETTP